MGYYCYCEGKYFFFSAGTVQRIHYTLLLEILIFIFLTGGCYAVKLFYLL